MTLEEQIVEHAGRYWWAWQTEDGRWTAPTPSLGGRYVGPLDYVCSGAAISRSRRRDLRRWLKSEALVTPGGISLREAASIVKREETREP